MGEPLRSVFNHEAFISFSGLQSLTLPKKRCVLVASPLRYPGYACLFELEHMIVLVSGAQLHPASAELVANETDYKILPIECCNHPQFHVVK